MKILIKLEDISYPNGAPLSEQANRINQLIALYGPDAILEFDAGANNVGANLQYLRDETSDEKEAREDREKKEKKNKKALLKAQILKIKKELKNL